MSSALSSAQSLLWHSSSSPASLTTQVFFHWCSRIEQSLLHFRRRRNWPRFCLRFRLLRISNCLLVHRYCGLRTWFGVARLGPHQSKTCPRLCLHPRHFELDRSGSTHPRDPIKVIIELFSFYSNNGGWKIGIAVTCFVLAVLLFSMFWFYSNALRIQSIFLDYARLFLHEVRGTFAYIFIFLIFLTGFIALITFQHVAFSSKSNRNTNFWDLTNPGLLGIFNILEFIWGFQFLRDACTINPI